MLISIILAVTPFCQPNAPEVEQECVQWMIEYIEQDKEEYPYVTLEGHIENASENLPQRLMPRE